MILCSQKTFLNKCKSYLLTYTHDQNVSLGRNLQIYEKHLMEP